MVNTGKPSRACINCRKRRIKCDQTRPHCGQCKKSKRDCLGYVSEVDIIFRPQTKFVHREQIQIEIGQSGLTTQPESSTQDHLCSPALKPWKSGSHTDNDEEHAERMEIRTSTVYKSRSPPTSLQPSIRSQALAYLFNVFARWESSQHSFELYQILSRKHHTQPTNSLLSTTTEALALMAFSKSAGKRRLRLHAAKAYSHAISSVRSAVSNPLRVRENGTLLSIILLSFAEIIDNTISSRPRFRPRFPVAGRPSTTESRRGEDAHRTPASRNWVSHAVGASLILKLRGPQDIGSSRETMMLAAFVSVQVLLKAIFNGEPLHDFEGIHAPLCHLDSHAPCRPLGHLGSIGHSIPSLRMRGSQILRKAMCPGLTSSLMTLLSDVRAADLSLYTWSSVGRGRIEDSIAGYFHKPADIDSDSWPAWPGAVYTHDSIIGMHAWNLLRTYRIFLQLLIFNILERLIAPHVLPTHPEFLACRYNLQVLVDAICATVPCCLGYLGQVPLHAGPARSESRTDEGLGVDVGEGREGKGPAVGAWYVVWPLYVAYNVVSVGAEQAQWIRGRLRCIGEDFGIDQAMEYSMIESVRYEPGIERPFSPFDYAPSAWVPLL